MKDINDSYNYKIHKFAEVLEGRALYRPLEN